MALLCCHILLTTTMMTTLTLAMMLFLTLCTIMPTQLLAATTPNTTTTSTATKTSSSPAAAASSVNIEYDVLHFSYELAHWLDSTKRPCNDFFSYVCDKSLNSTQAQLEQRVQREQERFDKFLWLDNDEQLLDAELKLKHFYDSCKHARSLDDLKSSFMYRMSGGWPAIDDAPLMIRKRHNMTWMQVLSGFHEVGLEYIFRHNVEIKSNKRVIHIEPDLSTRYTLRKFEQLADEVMKEYAVDASRARLIALEILNFERNRRDIVKRDASSNLGTEYTYADLKTKLFASSLHTDWDAYFRKILGKPLRASDTVLVKQLPKLVELFGLLQNTTMTRLLNWVWIDYLMDKNTANCQNLVQKYFEPIYQHIVERSSLDKMQMTQMYADIGRSYDDLLANTKWIDEISRQNSKQFLGRVMHLTLNGDAKLDADYLELTITKRNFYRNLEKAQRYLAQQSNVKRPHVQVSGNTFEITQAAGEFLRVFLTVNTLLQQQQNLTAPLNFALVGERFAEHMIASGSSTTTPGAWRSTDSEREFATLEQCIKRQTNAFAGGKYNLNSLILKMLAQQQTVRAFDQWQEKHAGVVQRLNNLLAAGRLKLSLRKLYYISTVLTDCRHYAGVEQKDFVHSYLRNSPEFTQTFGCRVGDELYARNVCRIL